MNRIKTPAVYSEAVSVISDVIDIFLSAERKVVYTSLGGSRLLSSHVDSQTFPMSLINTFGEWLFDAFNREE